MLKRRQKWFPDEPVKKAVEEEYLVVGIHLDMDSKFCGEYHCCKRASSGHEALKMAHEDEQRNGRSLHVLGVYRNAGMNLRDSS